MMLLQFAKELTTVCSPRDTGSYVNVLSRDIISNGFVMLRQSVPQCLALSGIQINSPLYTEKGKQRDQTIIEEVS